MLYQLLLPVARVALTWYYRSIAVAGQSRMPATGPVFLAVNHPNAMIDALVVACALPRRVRFTAKATIFSNPVAAAFLHNVGVIPLRRAADEVKDRASAPVNDVTSRRDKASASARDVSAGSQYDKDGESQDVHDAASQHDKDAASQDAHDAASGQGTGVALQRDKDADPQRAIDAASTHTKNDVPQPADAARNADSFRAVSDALANGSAVVIFPEGRSHDEPQMAPLRTGLARMALQARETQNVRNIQIIPVGLLFEQKEEPRSRILVQIGTAIDLDAFIDACPDAARRVESLTSLVAERLATVTLNFETRDDAERISVVSETLAALLEPTASVANEGPSLSTVLALVRRTARVRDSLLQKGPDSELAQHVAQYEMRINAFRARLTQQEISVADIGIDLGTTPGARFAIREAMRAIVVLPVSWWGRIMHFIPIRVARLLALRGAKNLDEPAMKTLLFGLVLVLASYAVETAIVWRIFGVWWALAFFTTLIPSASSDLRYGDVARRRSERIRTYFKFRRDPALQRDLLSEADWLRREAGTIEQLA